jgi:RNA polymerase sigma factor (sigma-70 family)
MAHALNNDEPAQWKLFQSGDKEALAAIYNNYIQHLYNYGAKFTQDEALIADTIQDTFIRLWDSRERLSVPASVKHYLLKSFRHTLFRKLEQAARHAHEPLNPLYEFGVTLSAEAGRISREEQQLRTEKLNRALQLLPPRQKEALFLRFYENVPYEEIARIMGTSVKAVYKAVFRALEKLKEAFALTIMLLLIYIAIFSGAALF